MTRQAKTVVVLCCDLHEEEVTAEETVSFSVRGEGYEMELCAEHLKVFDEVTGAWTAAARPGSKRRKPPVGDIASDEGGRVREWARANGYEVSGRGRIPQSVLDAFVASHGGSAQAAAPQP